MPLRDAEGKIVGTFGISRDITKRKIAEQQLAERNRQLKRQKEQMEEELKMAQELQLAMLPQSFPHLTARGKDDALEFFSFYFPWAAVSGDFFAVVELPDSKVGVFICDAMGHGVRAALITAMMRALVEDLSPAAPDPGHLLAQLNRSLARVFKQAGTTMYATAFYVVVDIARRLLLYAGAGHPAPLYLSRLSGIVERLVTESAEQRNPALGLFEQADYLTVSRPIAEGDLIALFTDGLIDMESARQGLFNEGLLLEAMRRRAHLPSGQLLRGLIADVQEFAGRSKFDDDVCLVGVEVKRLLPAPQTR